MSALGVIMPPDGSMPTREIGLDLDRLIGSHACVVANSGGGKSGLIRRLLETTHGRVQHIVLDIEDEFYTLRERFDYVIAGGDGGDVPATVDNAAGLALAALTHGFSLIVQLNDLGEDAPEFVGRFLRAMISAPRDLWHPALVVIDEAQRFAPQDGSTAASHGVKALTGQGRKRGFTAVLASQRIAKINADVRGDINNWLLGRVGQSLDRRTVADALGFSPSSAEARGLQGMPDRTFWGFGPAIAREPVLIRVADVETTPVKPGQAKVATPPAPEALREILSGLATAKPEDGLISGASDEGANLKVAALARAAEDDQLAELIRANAECADVIAGQLDEIDRLHGVIAGYQRAVEAQMAVLADISWPSIPRRDGTMPHEPLVIAPVVQSPSEAAPLAPATPRSQPAARAPSPTPRAAGDNSKPSPAAIAIVDLLDQINPARVTWTQAATMTGRKATGGNFNAARKWIRESGRIVEDGEFVRSSHPEPEGMSRAEALDLWKSVLSSPAPRMIDALESCARPIGKDDLGALISAVARGGNFNNGLAQLRRNGLLTDIRGGFVLARPLPGERA